MVNLFVACAPVARLNDADAPLRLICQGIKEIHDVFDHCDTYSIATKEQRHSLNDV